MRMLRTARLPLLVVAGVAALCACAPEVSSPPPAASDPSAGARTAAVAQWSAGPSPSTAAALTRAYFPELAAADDSSADEPSATADARALTAEIAADGSLDLATRGLSFHVSPRAPAAGAVGHAGSFSAAGNRHLWWPVGPSAKRAGGWQTPRLEEAWIVDDAGVAGNDAPSSRADYAVTLPASVRRLHDAGDYLEFLDDAGRPVLRFHPPVVRDANGASRRGSVRITGARWDAATRVFHADGPQVLLATEVSLAGLAAPLVVDPGWSSTAQMASPRAQHGAAMLSNGKLLVVNGTSRTGFVTTSEIFDPATGTWSSAASAGVVGNITQAVLLPTGKVFVLVDGNLTARLYDPDTDTWTSTGSMFGGHMLASLTVLRSGKVLVAGGYNSAAGGRSPLADLYDPATNTFSPAGNMLSGRQAHCATMLKDGRVLAISGTLGPSEVLGADLYDPATNSWTAAAPVLVGRHYAAATLLADGRVLLAGGFATSNATTEAEVYDPVANTWTKTGSMAYARSGHTLTRLTNGKVAAVGGSVFRQAAQTVTELYDPATGTWSSAGALQTGREEHSATLLPSGKVLVAGGYREDVLTFFASSEVFDPALEAWSAAGTPASPRLDPAAVLLSSGEVLVAGGHDAGGTAVAAAERYDRTTNAWTSAAPLATPRDRATATLLPSGAVLVAGGRNATGALDSTERYDPQANTWTPAAKLAGSRQRHTATTLADGRVLVVGGERGTTVLATAELYDPATDAWSAAGTLGVARSRHAALLLASGRLLVAGGHDGSGNPLASAELYDPATNAWTPAGALVQARDGFALTFLPSGLALATGGIQNTTALATTETYDPATNAWTAGPALPQARWSHTATLLASGKVLVAGGLSDATTFATTAAVFDPATHAWTAIAAPGVRGGVAAIALPSGDALLVGGTAGSGAPSAQLYGDNGADPAWHPVVTGPDVLYSACANTLQGQVFRGLFGGDSGQNQSSPSDEPLVRLWSIDDGRWRSLPGSAMSESATTVYVPADVLTGPHAVTVIANGIAGGRVVQVKPNRAPHADDASRTVPGGQPLSITLGGSDPDGQPLTFTIVAAPSHGTLTGTPPDVTYTSEPGYAGPDSFTFRVRDCGLDSNVATVQLTVVDGVPPAITCPADSTLEATAPSGAPGSWTSATATDDHTAAPAITYAPALGSMLPLGPNTITATAADDAGNQASCTFAVTVQDTTSPAISCPDPQQFEATSAAGASATFAPATATDEVTAAPEISYSADPGSTFAFGTTPITATAVDAAGNTSTCTFELTVQDTTPPAVTCPATVTAEATSAAGATVTLPPATATDAVTATPTITASMASGATFPLGTTSVTVHAEDEAGNAASCSFDVLVRDTTAPAVTCPSDVTVSAENTAGAVVSFALPEAVDAISAHPSVSASPAPGSVFAHGTTRVTVTARDAAENAATCSFEVRVVPSLQGIAGGGCQSAGESGLAGLFLLALLILRRRRTSAAHRSLVGLALLVLALAAPVVARAEATASLVPFDVERLRFQPGASDSLLVDTGRLAPEGSYRLLLLADYERGLLTGLRSDGVATPILQHRVEGWLAGAWSPRAGLELSARLPLILSQGGAGEAVAGVTPPTGFGLGTPEVGARLALLHRESGDPLSLSVGLELGLPGGSAPAFGRQTSWAGLQFAPRVAASRDAGPLTVGASLGARVRGTEEEPGRRIGTELEEALVAATHGEGLRAEVALEAAESLVAPGTAVELLAGVRLPFGPGFEAYAFAGKGFTDAPGSPSYRVAAGLAWARMP